MMNIVQILLDYNMFNHIYENIHVTWALGMSFNKIPLSNVSPIFLVLENIIYLFLIQLQIFEIFLTAHIIDNENVHPFVIMLICTILIPIVYYLCAEM